MSEGFWPLDAREVVRDMPQVVQVIGPPFSDMRCLDVADVLDPFVPGLTPRGPIR